MFFILIKVSVFILGVLVVIFECYIRVNCFMVLLLYKWMYIVGVKMMMGIVIIGLSYFILMGIGLIYFMLYVLKEYI